MFVCIYDVTNGDANNHGKLSSTKISKDLNCVNKYDLLTKNFDWNKSHNDQYVAFVCMQIKIAIKMLIARKNGFLGVSLSLKARAGLGYYFGRNGLVKSQPAVRLGWIFFSQFSKNKTFYFEFFPSLKYQKENAFSREKTVLEKLSPKCEDLNKKLLTGEKSPKWEFFGYCRFEFSPQILNFVSYFSVESYNNCRFFSAYLVRDSCQNFITLVQYGLSPSRSKLLKISTQFHQMLISFIKMSRNGAML